MAYDGEGNRVALAVTGSPTTYYLGRLEEIAGGRVTKYFTGGAAGSDLPLVERAAPAMLPGGQLIPGPLAYLPTDGLGSVEAALDGSGDVTYQALYTVWGRLRYTNGASPTDKGYTGQKTDSASGLDDYTARSYDPMSRQFTSADTVSDGPNPYAYVHENPCTNTDPSGHCIDKKTVLQKVFGVVAFVLAFGRKDFQPEQINPVNVNIPSISSNAPVQGSGEMSAWNPRPPVGDTPGTEWLHVTGPDPADTGGAAAGGSASGSTDILQNGSGGGCNNRGSGPNNPSSGSSPRNTTLPSQTLSGSSVRAGNVNQPWHRYAIDAGILRAEQRMAQLDWWVANYTPAPQPAPQLANPGPCLGPMCPLAWWTAVGSAVAGAVANAVMQSSEPEDVPASPIPMPGPLPAGPGGVFGAFMR